MTPKVFLKGDERKEKIHYPCLCQAIRNVLFWARIVGILPIISTSCTNHIIGCRFVVSKYWITYSGIIQAIYIPYFLTAYGMRLACGPNEINIPEWYVMTGGYFITDFDSITSLVTGLCFAQKTCFVLEKISKMSGPICEMRSLAKTIRLLTYSLLIVFLAIFSSFIYVAWLRLGSEARTNYYCILLDSPFGVILRGLSLIFPTIQCLVIALYGLLICNKFKNLAETTTLSMDRLSIANPSDSSSLETVKSAAVYNTCSRNDIAQKLDQLSDTHQELTYILREINKCIGFQLLVTTSSSLYTIVYYLYRYITAPEDETISNIHERIHYISGLLHRIAKMSIYIVLGRMVLNNSIKPLEVLRRSRIINLPSRLQQQIQSLMLQWYGTRGYFSACGVIKIGPWLLAPIAGNVITYLLVALQFNDARTNLPANVTAILESIF